MKESVISGDSGDSGLASGSQSQVGRQRRYHPIEDVYQAILNERRKRRAKVEAGLGIVVADDQRPMNRSLTDSTVGYQGQQ